MKHRTRKLANRWLAMVLCLCMIFPSAVTLVSAAEEVPGEAAYTGGICEHHPEHTEDCGYVEAVEGNPCQHEHTEDCYGTAPAESESVEPVCSHVHDESCGYAAPTEGTPCNHEHTEECFEWVTECVHEHTEDCYAESSVSDNTATPSNSEERELVCDHECSEESGCITQKNVCQHEHDSECGYSEGTEGTPCGHVHDESCGYLAAEESVQDSGENELVLICPHANGEHDESCGYVEAVEGHPCEYVCPICSGMQNGLVQLTEDDIEITLTNPAGYVGEEYNLLEKAMVTPEQDGDGNEIQLRITDLKADPTDAKYEWNNPILKVTENQNIAFTVTYEAYVELEDTDTASKSEATEKVLATQELAFNIYATGEIGERLDGDYAYISDAYLTADEETESELAIRTGTAPWDEDDSAGNDSSAMNNTVRSFDVVTYTAAFKTQVRPNGPYTAYKAGTVYYEFVVEGTKDLVRFETESMGWMTAKTEGKYEVTEETHDGKTYQVLRGSFLAEPADGNPAAIGNSYQELNIALRVLAMTQGDTVKPQFTFWLEGNDVPEDRLVTGSDYSCAEHDEQEYKTITAPDVSVTSAPRFNVRIVNGHGGADQAIGTFDFSTGNDLAQNSDAGTKEGRIQAFGVVIQIVGKSPQHGLRGCELPGGSPITFDLSLTSSYRTDKGETITPDEAYTPLLWSIDGNLQGNGKQSDKRDLSMVAAQRSYNIPTNEYESYEYSSCFNGGKWEGTQSGETIQVTISGYAVDLEQLPYNNIVDSATTYRYYDPNNISGYWDIQTACFSAGEIWVVQPFYDNEGKNIADQYGSGTFQITLEDTNLQVTGESGTPLDKVEDNTNQEVQTDDRVVQTSYLSRPGNVSLGIVYIPQTEEPDYGTLSLTEGCHSNGKDWILRGNSLGINGYLDQGNAEGQFRLVAADYLIKFDDSFFEPERVITYDSSTVLYGAKPEKTGWDHQNLQPDEIGYDADMMQATADDLIFFSSLDELKTQGYTCVAVLLEARKVFVVGSGSVSLRILGKSKDDSALDGNTFMITHSAQAWNKANVQEAVAKYLDKDASTLTDADYNTYVKSNAFPSRADKTTPLSYANDYPSSSWAFDYNSTDALKNYTKSQYDENGYVTGTAGRNAGDSCLVVDYATQITKSPNQPGAEEGSKKLTYDMDTSQREVDYVLYPTAIRSSGESTTEGASTTTTVYVEDTLPVGLEYIINSAYYGGEYTSNGGGKAGTVTGGQELYPTVTKNDDGITTLLFTLENVTITKDEITQLEPIYYSCTIGTPGNEETDVVNQQELLNSVKIWSDDEQIRDFVATNGNYAEQSIIISKNRAASFSKTSDQKIVEAGEEMGFTIHHGNNSSNSMDVVDIDFLPHNEDGRGTHITGQVIVSELTVQSKELINGFKLYYTTDTSKRNTTAGDYQASDFTEANGWTEMTVDANTGAVELPDVTHVIVAVAAVGKLTPNSTLKMHITFEVPDGKPGEFLVNSFGSGDMESNARTYIVNRLLEGVVWLDADKDGLRESGETLMNGVKVTLMQKGEDGTYAPYLLNGKTVSVETGKQIDVLTGTVSDNAEGAYGFLHLPQGDFAVKFEDGQTVKLGNYTATQANVGANDTIDSDAAANVQDGKLVSASIEGIEMPEAKKITVQTYESRHHDLGLYASQVNIPVEKVWNDNDDQDGLRPDTVTVKLKANGDDTGKTLTLSKDNNWQGAFSGLDQYLDGKEITYTIEEVSVTDYQSAITGSDSEGFTITNTHTPETINISGSKTWDDNKNQDGKRPASITIRLYANGTELTDKVQTVTADNDWKWSFTGLPKYANGTEIVYTITEDTVPGYTSVVSGYNVTNSYTPGKTSLTVTKAWNDAGNQDGIRPESITVKLLADGKDTGKVITLSKETRWMGIFAGLAEYKDGQKVVYTIEEVSVEGYDSKITGDASTGFVITNTHTPSSEPDPEPATGNLKVSKTVDGNSGDTAQEFHFTVTLSDTSISGTYGDMEFKDGVATFALKHGESKTASGLPVGVTYTAAEQEANQDGYTTTATGTGGTIAEGVTAEAIFTNTKNGDPEPGPDPKPDTGSLTVSKTVAGNDGDTTKEFHFTVTLSDTSIYGTYGGMTFENGVASFTLKHGESKTASGLPAGVTYTAAEQEAGQDGYTTTAIGDTGTIEKGQTAAAVFTNTRESTPPAPNAGSLVVSKTVSGSRGSTTKDFTFTVTLGDTSINGEYGDMTFHDGVAVFTLKHGESKTASSLPAGIRYTVTESDNSGYTVTAAGEAGTIEADKTATAAFHNYRGGSGGGGGGNDDNDIDVTVQKVWKLDNGGTAADSVTVMLRRSGTEYDTVSLNAQNGWRHTWYGLNDRYSWTVEETVVPEGFTMTVNQQGYTFTIVNDDSPSDPGTPDTPSTPGTPNDPGSPNTPNTPGQPGDPGQPGNPGQPGTPDTPDDVPKTGDTTNLALWIGLLAISGTGLAATLMIGKKKRYRRKRMK